MANGHILVLPFPAQGHVIPLMQLAHRLVEHGVEVTFVNTEANHALVLDGIHLVGVPDGLPDGDDRKDLGKLVEACSRHMPGHLERLVTQMEETGRPKVNWLVGDVAMGSSFEVAKKLGIRAAFFWPASAAFLASLFRIPQLVQDGVIDEKGACQSQTQFLTSKQSIIA